MSVLDGFTQRIYQGDVGSVGERDLCRHTRPAPTESAHKSSQFTLADSNAKRQVPKDLQLEATRRFDTTKS